MDTSIETESGLVVAREWGGGVTADGTGSPLGRCKWFGSRQRQLHNTVRVLNAAELFTLKWFILR